MEGYVYENEQKELFTDEGQRLFLKIRDRAHNLLHIAGAFRLQEVIREVGGGSSWQMLACVDRMVELGEIVECKNPISTVGQHRIFTNKDRL